MSIVDDIEAALANYHGSDNGPQLVVEPSGEDAATIRCEPPGHTFAQTALGHTIAPMLEAAGFRVALSGGLRPIPGLPRGHTGGTRFSNERAYQQRDLELPYLRVRRKA